MKHPDSRFRVPRMVAVGAWLLIGSAPMAVAQGRAGQTAGAATPAAPPTAKAATPIDLTGYWVSVITEDWRWRMVTPAKGEYASVPMTAEAKKMADAWNPEKDEASGEACRSYGAAALMRVPGRVRITWRDDNTLKIETDAGSQTRLFHFGNWHPALGRKPTWQGDSVAEWETVAGRGADGPRPAFGDLKVVTTNMRPGYLRKNGVPYSANAVLTEYWDLYKEKNGEQWLVITTYVDDPVYLQQTYITSPNFLREPNGSKWDPTPCSAKW